MQPKTIIIRMTMWAIVTGCGNEEPEPTELGEDRFVDDLVPSRNENHGDCDETPPNLLRNGAFEHQPTHACGWSSFDASNWGVITVPYCVTADHENCSIYLASEVWGDHWVAQFYQEAILEPGAPHVFTFEARAEGEARPLLVSILGGAPLRNEAGRPGLGAGVELELTTEWRTYGFSFVATDTAENSVVDFAIGQSRTGLYLDNVALIREPPPRASSDASKGSETKATADDGTPLFCDFEPPNEVLNGSFEYQPFESCGWSRHDTSDWGLRAETVCNLEDHESCALYIEPRIWGNPWIGQIFQAVWVSENAAHLLCFEARAVENARTVEVALIGAGNVTTLGSGLTVSLDVAWQTHCLEFTTVLWEESSVFVFAVAGSPAPFLLDNVSIRAVETSAATAD